MANLKLVGAVAIKVRPDAKGFRRETQVEIDRELAGFTKDVKVTAKVKADTTEMKADVRVAKEEIEKGKKITLKVGLDYDSVRAAQKQLDKIVAPTKNIKVDLKEPEKAQAKLDKLMRKSKVEITFSQDEQGYQEVLAKIARIRREKIEKTIKFKKDDASLNKLEAEMLAKIAALGGNEVEIQSTVNISYNKNRPSLERAIKEIDAELDKISAVQISVNLNPAELLAARARLEAELGEQTVKLEYDANEGGLRALRAKLEAMLPKLHIETTLDEAALREQLALLDGKIKAAEQNKLRISPAIDTVSYFKALVEIKTLTKNQTVRIFTRVDTGSLLFAAAKLTGLRAASRWTEEFARSLGTLDRNLPIVAAVVVGLSTLASGVLSLTANVFSLGNGLGEVLRMAGLLSPALLLGLGSVMTVFTGVFKDFGAAVNGDSKAIEKLSASGKQAAAEIRVHFQSIRETISGNFWDRAGDAMLRFTRVALPQVQSGLGALATSLGGIFSGVLESFSRLSEQSGIKVFFSNLTRGFDIAQTGLASFMSAFNTLAIVGSTMFPKIGRAFEQWATRFDAWVQRLAADGTLNRWIDKGIEGMHDLFNAGASIVKVWGNIGLAAQAAGAVTLHSFAQMMERLDNFTAGDRFQRNMRLIFQGAREAANSFHDSLKDLGPAMDVFSVTVKNSLSGAGKALGAFIATIGDVMASPKLNTGIVAFLDGIKAMFESLRPSANAVATILQTFGQVLGTVARDSGPLFRNLFQQLAIAMTTAWQALEPLLPGLVLLGTTIVNVLGPALTDIARSAIPAFATGVEKIGTGLVPLIKVLADVAVGFTQFVSGLPLGVVVGFGAAIVTLGTSMRIAATVVPLAAAALEVFGVTAAITAARVQLMIPVVGLFLAALTGGIAAAVTGLATSQKNAAPFASSYAAALEEDARAANNYSDAIGEATLKTAAKNLVDSGAFQLAEKLGISHETLTKAVTGNGAAYDEVTGKIGAANKTYSEAVDRALKAAAASGEFGGAIENDLTPQMAENNKVADELNGKLGEQKNSFEKARSDIKLTNQVLGELGIKSDNAGDSQQKLGEKATAASRALGEAAAATTVLTDTFSSSQSKIDAMRKSLELLVGPNVKQQAAESLGAYAKGFQDLMATVVPLEKDIRKLGDSAYGENGFLNVASGNKAVLQLNQALVDQVNNLWLGAKAVYDAAIKAGDGANTAFAKSRKFIDDRKGDYDQLVAKSGLAADKVNGQWDAVFGKDWVLRVSLEGTTEAFVRAQQIITMLHGQFDGQKFQAYLDANPDKAVKAFTDVNGLALDFVNHEWKTSLDAVPDKAEAVIQGLIGYTNEQWTNGDFLAILAVSKKIPGLAEALQDIRNGVALPFYANIFAQLNGASVRAVEIALLSLTYPRTVAVRVAFDNTGGGNPVARGGQRVIGSANGSIMNSLGHGQSGFRPARFYANGGIENHVAQISRPNGPLRIWGERETQGEAYVPLAASKRPRSVQILKEVANRFGYQLTKAQQFANGGTTVGPTSHTSADVHIGSIHTVDMNEAVAKLRQSQRDALAVAGISSIGV
ncbi:MAG TPA: hypothetical protein VF867_12850 [Arthrobacter sp.]